MCPTFEAEGPVEFMARVNNAMELRAAMEASTGLPDPAKYPGPTLVMLGRLARRFRGEN
jgi:hypothetical protein